MDLDILAGLGHGVTTGLDVYEQKRKTRRAERMEDEQLAMDRARFEAYSRMVDAQTRQINEAIAANQAQEARTSSLFNTPVTYAGPQGPSQMPYGQFPAYQAQEEMETIARQRALQNEQQQYRQGVIGGQTPLPTPLQGQIAPSTFVNQPEVIGPLLGYMGQAAGRANETAQTGLGAEQLQFQKEKEASDLWREGFTPELSRELGMRNLGWLQDTSTGMFNIPQNITPKDMKDYEISKAVAGAWNAIHLAPRVIRLYGPGNEQEALKWLKSQFVENYIPMDHPINAQLRDLGLSERPETIRAVAQPNAPGGTVPWQFVGPPQEVSNTGGAQYRRFKEQQETERRLALQRAAAKRQAGGR